MTWQARGSWLIKHSQRSLNSNFSSPRFCGHSRSQHNFVFEFANLDPRDICRFLALLHLICASVSDFRFLHRMDKTGKSCDVFLLNFISRMRLRGRYLDSPELTDNNRKSNDDSDNQSQVSHSDSYSESDVINGEDDI